jgi:hypothetical protein
MMNTETKKKIISDFKGTLVVAAFLFLLGWAANGFSIATSEILFVVKRIVSVIIFIWVLRILFHFEYGIWRVNQIAIYAAYFLFLIISVVFFIVILPELVNDFGVISVIIGIIPAGLFYLYFCGMVIYPFIRGKSIENEL